MGPLDLYRSEWEKNEDQDQPSAKETAVANETDDDKPGKEEAGRHNWRAPDGIN